MSLIVESDDSSLIGAAKLLKIVISDKDAHSADVLYHQRCYSKFTQNYKPCKNNQETKDSVRKATPGKKFLAFIKTQVINQKYCFLLRDLVIEINDMYEKYDCEVKITRTKDLKKLITETFSEEIRFIPALDLHGSPLILHVSDVNPTVYVLASLVRAGFRDAEITVTFARMITAEAVIEFPVSLDTLTKKLDTYNIVHTYIGKEIFNVISY